MMERPGDSSFAAGLVMLAVSWTLPFSPCSGSSSPDNTSVRPSANSAGIRNSTIDGAFEIKSAVTTGWPSGCFPNRSSGTIVLSTLSKRLGTEIFWRCCNSIASGEPGPGISAPVATASMRLAKPARLAAFVSAFQLESSEPVGTVIIPPDTLVTSATLPLKKYQTPA